MTGKYGDNAVPECHLLWLVAEAEFRHCSGRLRAARQKNDHSAEMSAYSGLITNMFASAQHACLGQLRLIRIDLGRIGPLPGGPAGRVNYPGLVQERAKG